MGFLIRLLGEERLSKIYRAHAAKKVRQGMVAEFQDDKGRWYYSFRDEADVPITRLSHAHTNMQYMAAGLSADLFHQAMDEVTVALAKSNIVKAGAIISDLTDLNKKIVNLDAMINVVAVYYVREDEDEIKISNTIQQEKCDFLKSETEDGRFFFRVPRFVNLLGGQIPSSEELDALWTGYQKQLETLTRRFYTEVLEQ